MATMPLGYNTQVDEMVRTQKTGFDRVHYLKRINRANEWVETTLDEVIGAKYGSPYPCGNAIFVGFFRNNNP